MWHVVKVKVNEIAGTPYNNIDLEAKGKKESRTGENQKISAKSTKSPENK